MVKTNARAALVGGIMAVSMIGTSGTIITTDFTLDIYEINNKGIICNYSGYNGFSNCNRGVISLENAKMKNLQKIKMLSELHDDWNGNGASAFSASLISKIRGFIMVLEKQPEIFPTANDSIQFEYDKVDGSHLEIEIFENDEAELFIMYSNGEEQSEFLTVNADVINRVVKNFYG